MRIRLQGRANENAAHGTIEIAKMNDDAPLWWQALIVGGIILHVCMLVDHAMYTHIIAFKLLNRNKLGTCKKWGDMKVIYTHCSVSLSYKHVWTGWEFCKPSNQIQMTASVIMDAISQNDESYQKSIATTRIQVDHVPFFDYMMHHASTPYYLFMDDDMMYVCLLWCWRWSASKETLLHP